jgi:hypothetical protein
LSVQWFDVLDEYELVIYACQVERYICVIRFIVTKQIVQTQWWLRSIKAENAPMAWEFVLLNLGRRDLGKVPGIGNHAVVTPIAVA